MKKYLAMSVAVTAILASCNPSNTTTPTSTTFTSTYAGWTGGAKDVELVSQSVTNGSYAVLKTGTITAAGVISVDFPSKTDIPTNHWYTPDFSSCVSQPNISDKTAKQALLFFRVKGTSTLLVQTDGDPGGLGSGLSRAEGTSAATYVMADKSFTWSGTADCSPAVKTTYNNLSFSDGKMQGFKDTLTKKGTPSEVTVSSDSVPSTLPWKSYTPSNTSGSFLLNSK